MILLLCLTIEDTSTCACLSKVNLYIFISCLVLIYFYLNFTFQLNIRGEPSLLVKVKAGVPVSASQFTQNHGCRHMINLRAGRRFHIKYKKFAFSVEFTILAHYSSIIVTVLCLVSGHGESSISFGLRIRVVFC